MVADKHFDASLLKTEPEITDMKGFQQSTCVRKATYEFADLVAGLGFSLLRSRWDKGKTFDDTVRIHEKIETTFFFPSI